MRIPTLAQVGAAAFFGKIAATLFIAVCAFVGFGPDIWAAYLVRGTQLSPENLRGALLVLGCITALFLGAPTIRKIWPRVEPLYLVVLGLVIALLGAGWLIYRGNQPAVLSREQLAEITKPFRDQIDALQQKLESAPVEFTQQQLDERVATATKKIQGQLDTTIQQLAAATQGSRSIFGSNFIENLELKFSDRDPDLVVISGTAANAIATEMDVSVDYRTMGLKGTQPMDTPRYSLQSVAKIEKTRKGVQVEIPVLHKMGTQYVFGDGTNPGLGYGDIAYVRLVIVGPNDEEQHIYFQVVWWVDRQPLALIYPPLTSDWAAAWEATK